jgi:hypothetical protein
VDDVVIGMRSNSLGSWPAPAAAPREGDRRPSSVPHVAIPAPLPPARGTAAPPWSSPTARHQVNPV